MRIGVSIVTFNTDELVLRKLVRSINEEGIETRIVVVDNSLRPSNYSILCEIADIDYVFSGKNLGYGAGHNLAIRRLDAKEYPYHLVVNPDVYWNAPVLVHLLSFMNQNPDVALAMPKILYPDGRVQYTCKLLPTPVDLIVRRFLPIRALRELLQENYELRFTRYSRDMNVPYLSGCFMFLRRSSFDEVGGFDERFFMYPEDIDLTRRLHVRWRTMFVSSAAVVHGHARASYASLKMLLVHAWNICKYFNKWGWFFDPERRAINRGVLRALEKKITD